MLMVPCIGPRTIQLLLKPNWTSLLVDPHTCLIRVVQMVGLRVLLDYSQRTAAVCGTQEIAVSADYKSKNIFRRRERTPPDRDILQC